MTRAHKLPRLKFNKSILPSIEESIPTKELISRLKDLSDELSSVDQDNIDLTSLEPIKQQIINKKLTRNNNAVVQSYVACCLSDILRIFAPDAPFTASQLSDIFKLFFSQFKHLNEQDTNGCFPQHFYLLSKLSEVRSIILITDLPDSEKLIESIFEIFYNLANQPNFPIRLEPLICDILSEIVSESDTIPTKVLKLILNKFLNDNAIPNTVNPSLNFTLSICNTNTDRMSRLITQFFSELIYEGSRDENASAKFIDNLKKLHKLSTQVWRYIPELLASVMGLIEDELEAEDITIRMMATETVSKIIAIQPSKLNFNAVHSDTYTSWLKKTLDVSPIVRCKWVETTLPILLSNKQDVKDIASGLTKSLLDTDEKVRFTTCKTLAELPSKLFLNKIASQTIMTTLSQLLREKHPQTRVEIIKLLGNLYNDCFDEEKNNKLLSWIPEHILNLIYINERNINCLVDLCFCEKLVPFEDNVSKRVERILFVVSQLSDKAKSSFYAILKRQQQVSGVLLQLLKVGESFNGGNVVDGTSESELRHKADKIMDWLAAGLPTYYNSKLCLNRLFRLNNRRFFKLIKLCISADSDYETVKFSMKELFNKITDPKTIRLENDITIPPSDMLNVFKLLMYRSSLIIANRSNVPLISEISKDAGNPLVLVAKELLESISTNVPGVFKSHIHELTAFVIGYTPEDAKGKYAQTLKTIYQFLKQYQEYNEQLQIDFYDVLSKLALKGSVMESRYSVRIICLSRHKYSYAEDIFDLCYPLKPEAENLTTHLAVIAELYLSMPQLLENSTSEITTFLIKDILLTNENTSIEDRNEEEWIDDSFFEKEKYLSCQHKLLALRIFTNRLIALATPPEGAGNILDERNIQQSAEPVFKLFMSLMGNGGEIVKNSTPTPKNYQSKLRLSAGLMLLTISKVPVYNKLLTPQNIGRLIFLVQDECQEVREEFVNRLQRLLYEDVISERFAPLLFFAAHEPVEALKENVKTWIRSSFARKNFNDSRNLLYERSFVRLLHMIAHHQEYHDLMDDYWSNGSEDTLMQSYLFSLEYISFYLSLIGTAENISLLYYLASRVKQYRDNMVPIEQFDEFKLSNQKESKSSIFNVYRISELAQMAIKELTHSRGWTLSTYPSAFKLSADLFTLIKDQEEAQYVVQTVFIEEAVSTKLSALVKSKMASLGAHNTKRSLKDNTNQQNKKVRSVSGALKKKIAVNKTKSARPEELKNSGPIRRSGRNTKRISYATSDGEDEYEVAYHDENNGVF